MILKKSFDFLLRRCVFGVANFSPPRLVAAGPPQFRGEDVEGHTTSGPGGVEKVGKTHGVFGLERGLKGKLASPKMVNCVCLCMVCLEYNGLFRKLRGTCFGFILVFEMC